MILMWRDATPADDDLIVQMCNELNQEDPGPEPVPEENVRRTLAALRAEPVRGKTVVLEVYGRMEGYAFLISFWSNELGGEMCNIDEVYVRPQHRSQGHGQALIEAIARGEAPWGRGPVMLELEVSPSNIRAARLYEQVGFRPIRNTTMRRAPRPY